MATVAEPQQGARVILVPPPLYYVVGFVVGLVADGVLTLPIGGRPGTTIAGALLAVLGVALAVAGVAAVIRHRTTIVPHHPVAALLTGGPYRLSRNPMYTGLAITYLGLALVVGSWWPVVLWPLVIIAVHRLVIRPEERYLTERFGTAYTEYRARVRRWL